MCLAMMLCHWHAIFMTTASQRLTLFQEWNQLKYELLHQGQERASTWSEVLKEPMFRSDVAPNLATLAQILLCFCAENAEVERGFSVYNIM